MGTHRKINVLIILIINDGRTDKQNWKNNITSLVEVIKQEFFFSCFCQYQSCVSIWIFQSKQSWQHYCTRYAVCWHPQRPNSRFPVNSGSSGSIFAVCRWGVFTLCDRTCGAPANESLAQWYSGRTQGPLQAPFRELEAGEVVSGRW